VRRVPPVVWVVLLLVVAYADILFAGRGLFLHDITLYHYPLKHVVREIVSHGSFPLWNRYLSGGQPLAANPAYEVFYPFQWLIFLPSFHFGFQLHVIAHFVLAALGMYRLARALGCSATSAAFASATFVFCGPYLSLSSKLPLLFSYSWMPWALTVFTPGGFIAGVIALAAQLLIGEPTVLLQTLALLGGYAVVRKRIRYLAAVGVIAAAVAAIQLIPSIDFARDTVRSQPFPFEVVSNWSTPAARALELAAPRFFDRILGENGRPRIASMYPYRVDAFLPSFYLGIATLILGLAGIVAWRRGAPWVVLIVAAFGIVALGERTPLLRIMYDVGLRSIRYPEKFVLAPALVMVLWSAIVLDDLLNGDRRVARNAKVVAAIAAAVALIAVVTQGRVEPRWYAAEIVARFAVISAFLLWRRPRWAGLIVIVAVLDVWSATRHVVPRMPRRFFDPPPIAREIPATGRVYPEASWDWWDGSAMGTAYFGDASVEQYWWTFRNGGFVYLPMYWGRELALEDDVDRTSLLNTEALREALKRARAQHADESYLRIANVHSLLRFNALDGSARSNMEAIRPVQVVQTLQYPRFSVADGTVQSVDERDNSIRLTVQARARTSLVMSITAHRYWSAFVDGQRASLEPADIAYQSLTLEPGTHTVEMRYRNPMIAIGALVSLLGAVALATARAWLPRVTGGSPA
jgi:hypothetical protein